MAHGGWPVAVNHDCDPNLELLYVTVGDVERLVFFARKLISPGDWLTWNYAADPWDEQLDILKTRCLCRTCLVNLRTTYIYL
eukprot:tig00020531_g10031.t1